MATQFNIEFEVDNGWLVARVPVGRVEDLIRAPERDELANLARQYIREHTQLADGDFTVVITAAPPQLAARQAALLIQSWGGLEPGVDEELSELRRVSHRAEETYWRLKHLADETHLGSRERQGCGGRGPRRDGDRPEDHAAGPRARWID